MRTVPYLPTVATPRPALTPSSSRSQTPTLGPSVPPEKCPVAGPCSSSRSVLHHRPNYKEPTQSSVDSSGYSSSEGPQRKPTAASTDRIHGNSVAPGAGYRSRMSSAFSSLMSEYEVCVYLCVCVSLHAYVMISLIHLFCADSVSLMAATAQSKIGMLLMYIIKFVWLYICICVHYVHICACFSSFVKKIWALCVHIPVCVYSFHMPLGLCCFHNYCMWFGSSFLKSPSPLIPAANTSLSSHMKKACVLFLLLLFLLLCKWHKHSTDSCLHVVW